MNAVLEHETGTQTENTIDLRRGDGCWLERRTHEFFFSRGMGLHPVNRSLVGMAVEYFDEEKFAADLTALADRLNLKIVRYSDDGHCLHYLFE